jgi:ribosome maturation factor RimP
MSSNGKCRLPNKVQWCLEDIVAGARRSHRYLAAIADRTDDVITLTHLVELSRELGEILMHAVNARHNEYLEHPLEGTAQPDLVAALET